jgi:uncharacterized repeat protein (TIGR03803 family)
MTSKIQMRAVNLVVWSAIMIAATLTATSALHAQAYQVIHHFASAVDGAQPNGLARDATGNLFGTTQSGGSSGLGTVFKLDSTTHGVTVLYNFINSPDGARPIGPVSLDSAGNIYGTTIWGGVGNVGTVFKIDSNGAETILHAFSNLDADGAFPSDGLTWDRSGNLYGITNAGGIHGGGVVFRISTLGTERTLYRFSGSPDGSQPVAGLARDSAGNLYGTTLSGGSYDYGSVFKLARNGTETVLHSFSGSADGAWPWAEPVLDSVGNLYGTTSVGGNFNKGTVFKIDGAGNFSVMYSFNGRNGDGPQAGLVLDSSGNLYGNTSQGGFYDFGVVFKIDPSGHETVLHSFAGGDEADGATPLGRLLLTPDGTIFGSTIFGGFHGDGVLFRLLP